MSDKDKLRELADQLICHPVSRSITKIEEAGEAIKCLLDELKSLREAIEADRAQRVPACRVADAGFRWDGDRQEHIPQLVIEFEPVPAIPPRDEKGWTDRDRLAAMLAAAPKPVAQPSDVPEVRFGNTQPKPEQDAQPVAYMTEDGRVSAKYTVETSMPNAVRNSFTIPLYTRPAPKPVPLTDEQIEEWWARDNELEDCNMAKLSDFTKVVRAVEAAHGITGETK